MSTSSRSQYDPATRRILLALCLSVLLALTGCSAGIVGEPPSQRGPVGLNVTNAANETYAFEVSVVGLPANATVQWSDNKTETVDLGAGGIASNDPGDYHKITAVELPRSARLHGQYTLEPGETNISNISNFGDNSAVVITISRDGNISSWVSSKCDGDLAYLGVTMRYYGSDSVYDCN